MKLKRITNRMPIDHWRKITMLVLMEKEKPAGERRFNSIQEFLNKATEEKLEKEN